MAGSVKSWSSNIRLQENATFGKYPNKSQDSEERGLLEDHSYNFPHHKSFSVNFFFFRSFTDISSCIPYGINTSLFENGGYCKLIIGNVAVNGTPELEDNEEKLRHYETNIQSLFDFVNPPQSCTEKIDDIYCHHYFKRCFIDSPVQTVCREACETFRSVCKKMLAFAPFLSALKINVHVIDCTVLPSRDESSICYDPDTIRG